jgi:hypothetical protein
MGIILKVLRTQVFVYNVYITNQYKTKGLTESSKEENSLDFLSKYVQ